MEKWKSIFEQIPATFWGVLAGSFFSLAGVMLSNRNSARNLRAQFQNDRSVRATKREMTLRKDIFLAAAEALAAGFNAVGRFSDLQKDGESLTGQYLEKSTAIAKVHIVGDIDSIKSVLAVQSGLESSFIRLHIERIAGLNAKNNLAIVAGQTKRFLAQQSESLELMNQENLLGRPNEAKWNAIQQRFKYESDTLAKLIDQQRALDTAIRDEQLRLAGIVSRELLSLNGLVAPAIAAARRELGMPIDQDLMHEIVTTVAKKNHDALAEFIEQVRVRPFKPPPSPVA